MYTWMVWDLSVEFQDVLLEALRYKSKKTQTHDYDNMTLIMTAQGLGTTPVQLGRFQIYIYICNN